MLRTLFPKNGFLFAVQLTCGEAPGEKFGICFWLQIHNRSNALPLIPRGSFPIATSIPMRNHFNKLVRDRIPNLIRAAGYTCATEVLDEAEYRQALRAKLVEEAGEAAAADNDDLIDELADLHEVMMALMAAHGISPETVRKTQMLRREARGSFRQRIRLLWTETNLPQTE